MKMSSFIVLTVCIMSFIQTGCKSKDEAVAPVITGSLIGSIALFDLNGNSVANLSNTQITLEGKNVTAKTDSTGRWKLQGVAEGTYTLVFSKNGYGSRKIINYHFAGIDSVDVGLTSLYQYPGYWIYNLSPVSTVSGISIYGRFIGSWSLSYRNIRLFFGKSLSVSSDPAQYVFSAGIALDPSASEFYTSISQQILTDNGFASGKEIFVAAYSEGFIPNSYTDPVTGRQIYPNINPNISNRINVTIP